MQAPDVKVNTLRSVLNKWIMYVHAGRGAHRFTVRRGSESISIVCYWSKADYVSAVGQPLRHWECHRHGNEAAEGNSAAVGTRRHIVVVVVRLPPLWALQFSLLLFFLHCIFSAPEALGLFISWCNGRWRRSTSLRVYFVFLIPPDGEDLWYSGYLAAEEEAGIIWIHSGRRGSGMKRMRARIMACVPLEWHAPSRRRVTRPVFVIKEGFLYMYIYFCWMDKTDERLICESSRQWQLGGGGGCLCITAFSLWVCPWILNAFYALFSYWYSAHSLPPQLSKVSLSWLKVHTCVPPAAGTQVFGAGGKKWPFQCVVFSLGTAAGQLRVQRWSIIHLVNLRQRALSVALRFSVDRITNQLPFQLKRPCHDLCSPLWATLTACFFFLGRNTERSYFVILAWKSISLQ